MSHNLFIASGIFHPESGGPATYLYRILPELQARGWSVRLLTYSNDPPPVSYPYEVTRIPRRLLPVRLTHYARAARELLAWADVVYMHTLGLPLVGSLNAPRVVKIVGDQGWERAIRKRWIDSTTDVDAYQTMTLSGAAAVDRAFRAREARALDGVIVPSAYLARMVVGWGVLESKIHVIYNAPPPSQHDDSTRAIGQNDARRALNLPLDVPILLSVGRLVPWKGIDHVIEALRRLSGGSSQRDDWRLIVVGDGEGANALKAQAADLGDRVAFVGRVGRERVPLYLRAADYLVLYSGYEGLSHTLLESLAVGTPLIASDKGGNPEVVQDGVNGLLVPYIDRDALTAAIAEALTPGTRDRLAAGAHIDRERFDFARMVDATDALLRQFAEDGA